jgi:hypothetical protein
MRTVLIASVLLGLFVACLSLPVQQQEIGKKPQDDVSDHKPIELGKQHVGLGEPDLRKYFDIWKTRIAGSVQWTKVCANHLSEKYTSTRKYFLLLQ